MESNKKCPKCNQKMKESGYISTHIVGEARTPLDILMTQGKYIWTCSCGHIEYEKANDIEVLAYYIDD